MSSSSSNKPARISNTFCFAVPASVLANIGTVGAGLSVDMSSSRYNPAFQALDVNCHADNDGVGMALYRGNYNDRDMSSPLTRFKISAKSLELYFSKNQGNNNSQSDFYISLFLWADAAILNAGGEGQNGSITMTAFSDLGNVIRYSWNHGTAGDNTLNGVTTIAWPSNN